MGASEYFPTVESVTEHYSADERYGEISFSGYCVEGAARELRRVCSRDDVPVDERDVVVGAIEDTSHAQGAMMPYGCEIEMVDGDWHAIGEPDGYVVLVSAVAYEEDSITSMFADSLEDTTRHELAHACCFAEDGYTAESEGNHMDWLERLDAAHTTNGL